MTGRPAVEGVGDLDPGRDFAPIGQITSTPQAMMCHPSVPAQTMAEFIAYAKARPGQLNYASAGNGSLHHLGTELLKRRAGIDLAHIPYRGTGETISDLLAGRVQFYMNSPPPVLQLPARRPPARRSPPPAASATRRCPTRPASPNSASTTSRWTSGTPSTRPRARRSRCSTASPANSAPWWPRTRSAAARRTPAPSSATRTRPPSPPASSAKPRRWIDLVRAVGIKPD